MSYSFVTVNWSELNQKPIISNISINDNGEFSKIIPSINKFKSLNYYENSSNKPWININNHLISPNNLKIQINNNQIPGIENLNLINNFLINGNINPILSSNFNLGSSNYRWENLYLSGNSIYLDNFIINNSNLNKISVNYIQINDNQNNFIFLSLSNANLIFNSNNNIINTINFSNYSLITYSNNLNIIQSNINNYLLFHLNNLFTTDLIPQGSNNKYITNNIYNSNITFASNINVINNYKFKGTNLPFYLSNSNWFYNYIIYGSNIFDLNNENEFTINQKLKSNYFLLSNLDTSLSYYSNHSNKNWMSLNQNLIISSNNQIGIGTTNPNFKLDVNGDINFNQNLKKNNFIIPFSTNSKTNVIASNAIFNEIIGTNFGYFSFYTNGSIYFPQNTSCDILIVGAGGNGGLSSNCGGGGAGEIIAISSFSFLTSNYDIKIGINSDNSNLRITEILSNNLSVIKALGGGNGGDIFNNSTIGGSGGGGYSNISLGANAGIKWNNSSFSYVNPGNNGSINKGGDGGGPSYLTTITGSNFIVGEPGIGSTLFSVPNLKTTYGSGGDGNGGLGTSGLIIIKVPLNIQRTKFEGYIEYSNIDNKPIINDLFNSTNFINIGYNNQVNFPLGNVSWQNEWFLYIGKSPDLNLNSFIFWHLTSNINYKWWFNGSQTATNSEISDFRIKKNISDIQNPLQKLMLIKPKEYYICDQKDYLKKFGIIAQDISLNSELNHLVYNDTDFIANIFSYGSLNPLTNIIICDKIIKDNIQIDDEIKIILDNSIEKEFIIEELPYNNRYKKRFVTVMKIIDDYSFQIYNNNLFNSSEIHNLFIYGKKVSDFKKLDYSSLYSLNIAANQELIKIIKDNQIRLFNLEQRINKH